MGWRKLTGDEQLKVGDVVRVWSQVVGIGNVPTAIEIEQIAKRVERKDPRFRVESWSYPDESGRFFLKIRIVKPEAERDVQLAGGHVAAALVGAAVTAALVAMGFWAAHRMEKRVSSTVDEAGESIGEKVEDVGLNLAKWAAMAIVGYIAIKSVGGHN